MFTITFGLGLLWAQGHFVNGVCMKGILADSHKLDLWMGGIQPQSCLLVLAKIWSEDSYEETDPYVDNLALVLLHTRWCRTQDCVHTERRTWKPPRHYRRRTILKLMGSHRSHIQSWLSHPEDFALFHVAMRMGAQCCLWDNFQEILI